MQYTGSSYEGDKLYGRLEGNGRYTLPTKTRYEGHLKDGMFDGPGTLHFPGGNKFTGEWENGLMRTGHFIFSDGLQCQTQQPEWSYCTKERDRRFHSETCQGLKPAGRSQNTDKSDHIDIPDGFYDTGDGLYDQFERVVYDYDMEFRRNADRDEHNWILHTCRRGGDEYSEITKAKKNIMAAIIADENM